MTLISIEEQRKITDAITTAESNTSGEIVAVISPASSSYRFIALLWAALIALFLPLLMIYIPKVTGLPLFVWSVEYIYLVQMAVFVILALLVQWQPLRLALVPKSIQHDRAHRSAVEQFLAQNLHTSKSRTGVLIFVSAAERYAEVIADENIYEKVPRESWKNIVDKLTTKIQDGEPAQGFIAAIQDCGLILAEHFPPGTEDPNELPDHLIVLE